MSKERSIRPYLAHFAIVASFTLLGVAGNAQAPQRSPYSAPAGWTVSTYRAPETMAFLRCSAERHYDDGLTLTVAKNNAGNLVLGFTSAAWTYEDRSTHAVSVRIDSANATSLPGRVRLLPVGPIVFVDLAPGSAIIPALSSGMTLYVRSAETALEFGLTGSAAAIASMQQCHRDGTE
jgi:hypothetical protein